MPGPTRISIHEHALIHNLNRVKQLATGKKIIAMVKANAYGCDLKAVIPVLDGHVHAFGVACIEEALAIRALGSKTDVILFQGVFDSEELHELAEHDFSCVIHQIEQLNWLLSHPLSRKLRVWVKVNTGMNRLGFLPEHVQDVINALQQCLWVDSPLVLMTHFACADEPEHPLNKQQQDVFNAFDFQDVSYSAVNSAGIFNYPELHRDAVRPGIMLYGISPFPEQSAQDLNLLPVMRFVTAISAIHHYPAHVSVGYGAEWQSGRDVIIGILPAGYGDGYPRHLSTKTYVWVNQQKVPIVGRISMDMMAIDLTDCPDCRIGDEVELWGNHIHIEDVARSAETIAYELICKLTARTRRQVF